MLASRQSARIAKAAARRNAILDAALEEFSARGFAAARLDDVARRAGVAKGTIYLHFEDKEALFQELIRVPAQSGGRHLRNGACERPAAARDRRSGDRDFRSRNLRHPPQAGDAADHQRGTAVSGARPNSTTARCSRACSRRCGRDCARALERGEIADDTLIRFPQLLGAPRPYRHRLACGLFDRFEPLDVRAHDARLFRSAVWQAGRPA